jgi:hypothetical protein
MGQDKPTPMRVVLMSREVKVGVEVGGGPTPHYRWTVWILDIAFEEAMSFLTDEQYQHMAMQVKELAMEVDPTHSTTASVDAIQNYHELRDKGGILGKLNVRIFFYVDQPHSRIVVIGAIKKQNDGQTPNPVRIQMARRVRKYLNGDYGAP